MMDDRDADCLELLDRIKDRVGLDLHQHEVEWQRLDDGSRYLARAVADPLAE